MKNRSCKKKTESQKPCYLVDTNVVLRFLLKDDKQQYQLVAPFFLQAEQGQIQLELLGEVIPELEYVLKKLYQVPRSEISQHLQQFLKNQRVKCDNKMIWLKTFALYEQTSIDPVDIFLYLKARQLQARVLSFDQDFKKIASLAGFSGELVK